MKLEFTKREEVGKHVSKLRKRGVTPVVCYGKNRDSQTCSVDTASLLKFAMSDEVVAETEGDMKGDRVVLQDISFHPVSGMPLHADFLFVSKDDVIEHEVHVRVSGEAPAVKVHGGQMIVALDKIVVRALPHHMPSHIDIDVSSLETIGSHILVSDVSFPDTVTVMTSPDEIVISIVSPSDEDEEDGVDEKEYIENIEASGEGKRKEDTGEPE